MNKKKIIASIFAVLVLFVVALRHKNEKSLPAQNLERQPINVWVKSAADSKVLTQENHFPANVAGDQEVKVTAKSSGTIIIAPNNIGDRIGAGSLLAKIDDAGSLAIGNEGLKSLQVQQAQIATEQAKKSYSLAKDAYDNLKKSDTATDEQIDSAKTQKDIAKLQYENASLGLSGSVDNHLITSPISGVITNKAVSVGDSVSAGQLIATISKSSNIKVQFYVDQNQRATLTRGQEISAIDANNKSTPLVVQNISVSADPITKRFLIEAYPKTQGQVHTLLPGTIATVSVSTSIKPKNENNLILPLSAISIGHNESFIFVEENGAAKKIVVTVENVSGETAEISSPISSETLIIVSGNKLVREGEKINVQK
ncbi:MAG: RND family efflux system membrane fusion protein [uncultured bacterium]|nr:MAG: RND family efflux system membrane fusion protein [uncultured bacterium]